MKKLLIVAIAGLLLWSCGNKTQFTLKGEIVPAPESGSVILHGFENGNPVAVDTSSIIDGKFSFKGNIEMPEMRLLSLDGQRGYIAQLFVDANDIDVTVYPDSFASNVVVGSEANDVYQIYMDEIIKATKNEEQLKQRFAQAQATQNEDELNAVRFEFETMVENTKLYSKNFINEYSESPVAVYVYLMNFFQEAQLEELDSMLGVFSSMENSDFVKALQERADALRSSAEGAIAPDFTLNDPEGNEVTLSNFKGKYVLVDFWASWCQPCMMELPNVFANYEKYKDKGFEVIGVSLDRDRDAWIKTIADKNMSWVHCYDMEGDKPGAVANLYGVTGIPYTLLLDKEGKIIAKNLRGPALGAELAKLMD